jgi:mannose-6-phosphate isomerase-like protein (cupin superfamily)
MSNHGSIVLTQEQAESRRVKRSDYTSCSVAFIDCKKPGSHLKENYAIIGPGVSSANDQFVNLPEAHGFNVGAAGMPNGITNNLHIHFTAEVFIVQKGSWTFRWGSNGEHSFEAQEGDVLSVPTWIFRGFTNTGSDDGWIFTMLGGDNTGGVIFHPDIITEAAEYGLYISKENMLIDTSQGDPLPVEGETIPPMRAEDLAALREISPEEMGERIVANADRDFRPAFIDANLPGCGAELAPILGYGITQNRDHAPKITNPHTFSMEWLRIQPGQKVSSFILDEKMVMIMRKGAMRLHLNEGGDVTLDLNAWETYSVPDGVVRSFECLGDEATEILVAVTGDHRKWPRFQPAVIEAARQNGMALDAGGYAAKASLLPNYQCSK